MLNIKYYEHILIDKGLTDSDVARMMDITLATLVRKKRGESDFYVKEIEAFKDKAGLTMDEAISIFFAPNVAYKQQGEDV